MDAKGTEQPGGLREQRRVTGLSQQKLAERAGCSIGMIRLLEAGYRPRWSDVLERITAALAESGREDEDPA
jgi:transcriptional regulator with XRE-family HTH domain